MIRILWLFILTVVLYWALKELFPRGQKKDRPGPAGEEMVKDPNCGVYLPRSSAIPVKQGGNWLYFCCEECRKAYNDRAQDAGRNKQE